MPSAPKKISFIRHSLYNRGGDAIALNYAGYLAKSGHDVTVWVNFVDTIFNMPPRLKVKRLSFKSKIGTILKAAFTKFDSDIVLADIIILAFCLSLRNNRNLIYMANDYDEFYYRPGLMRLLIRALYFYTLKIKRIPVIAMSQGLYRELNSRLGIEANVVSYGINFNEFYPEPDEGLLKEKGKRKAILIFARSDYRKGVDIASKVLKRISDTIVKDNIVIWAIGGHMDVPGLCIKNFGLVKADFVRKVLSSSDVFLFPSRNEGFGLIVIEAMACGCPVLTTTAVTVVQDNRDALVGEAEDVPGLTERLKRLLQEDDLRKRLIYAGYDTARNYDINKSNAGFEKSIFAIGEARYRLA